MKSELVHLFIHLAFISVRKKEMHKFLLNFSCCFPCFFPLDLFNLKKQSNKQTNISIYLRIVSFLDGHKNAPLRKSVCWLHLIYFVQNICSTKHHQGQPLSVLSSYWLKTQILHVLDICRSTPQLQKFSKFEINIPKLYLINFNYNIAKNCAVTSRRGLKFFETKTLVLEVCTRAYSSYPWVLFTYSPLVTLNVSRNM